MRYRWELARGEGSPEATEANSDWNIDSLANEHKVPAWTIRLLRNRADKLGISAPEQVRGFLYTSLRDLPDPMKLMDMPKAAERVAQAVRARQQIAVYGDYDVDGTVGAALLRRFFRALGLEPIVYQPDRALEGYGLNSAAIRNLASQGVQLLISVDCGISNVKEAEVAAELGLDLIIVDHHEVPEPMPKAFAVLDHRRKDEQSGISGLCGAGMGFYLAMAVRSVLREQGFFSATMPEPDLRDWLDLLAVATIADMVPLVAENRILARAGLEKLRRNPVAGLRALCEVSGTELSQVRAYHIGFVIGPRINASGRLGSANQALELLSTDDPEVAAALASELHAVNAERVLIQKKITTDAIAQAERLLAEHGEDLPAIVVGDPAWHEGVIGIVAAKLVDRFQRPAIVCCLGLAEGRGKGSVRSFQGMDALAALEECRELLLKFGGHKAAAGLTLAENNFAAFQLRFAEAIGAQALVLTNGESRLLPKILKVDIALTQEELTKNGVLALESLGPFGIGYPEPVFMIEGVEVKRKRLLKEEHLKLDVRLRSGSLCEAMWFNSGEVDVVEGEHIDAVFTPQIGRFRGVEKLEMRLKDLRRNPVAKA